MSCHEYVSTLTKWRLAQNQLLDLDQMYHHRIASFAVKKKEKNTDWGHEMVLDLSKLNITGYWASGEWSDKPF